jgi:hypothetical protein
MKLFILLLASFVLNAHAKNDFKNPDVSLLLCLFSENPTFAHRLEWTDWKKTKPHRLQA